MVVGANVGTASTALIASFAGTRESKRVAVANVIFRLINGLMFAVAVIIFPGILSWFEHTWSDGGVRAAMLHLIYNGACAVVLIFFTKQMAALTMWILPDNKVRDAILTHIKEASDGMPVEDALKKAHAELCRMGKIVLGNLRMSLDACYTGDANKADLVFETERTVNHFKRQIMSWLVRIQNISTLEDMQTHSTYIRASSDFERIGDFAENFAESDMIKSQHEETDSLLSLSQVALDELKTLGDLVLELLKLSLYIFETHDVADLKKVYDLEQQVDSMADEYIENHINRVNNGECDPRRGILFANMISDLERCADHAYNIAYYYPIMNVGERKKDKFKP